MPRLLIEDAHEPVIDGSTVPGRVLLKLQVQANSPGCPDGKRRPCRVLLQLGVDPVHDVHRITRRLWAVACGRLTADSVILVALCTRFYSGLNPRTPPGGQLGWGATPLKRYQRRPKVSSGETETRCKSIRAKACLTMSLTPPDVEANAGSSDLFVGIRDCE